MLTAEVVLPTPPFWFATTTTRVRSGRGIDTRLRAPSRASTEFSAARASGVVSSSNVGREVAQVARRLHVRRASQWRGFT